MASGKLRQVRGAQHGSAEICFRRLLVALCVCLLAGQVATAQEAAQAPAGDGVTVHGVVHNAATGEPLARALVRIEGDAATGALTDGEGRFEISGVPMGPQAFRVIKPGFRDRPYVTGGMLLDDAIGPPHNVMVAASMPELGFDLAPTCAIQGQIELSTGDSAQGLDVELLRRMVQNGRAVWVVAASAKTNSEGIYRFAELADGVYAVHTQPAMEAESATNLLANGSEARIRRSGYASTFYPGVRELSGAAKLNLSNGEQTQANFALSLEPFQPVSAKIVLPRSEAAHPESASAGGNPTIALLDVAGQQLAYPAQYDSVSGSFQLLLPDGAYTAAVRIPQRTGGSGRAGADPDDRSANILAGAVDFSVAGQRIANLRIPVSVPPANSLQVTLQRSATSSANLAGGQRVDVMAIQTGGSVSDGMSSMLAENLRPGANATAYLPAGSYWLQTVLGNDVCEQSFTAGGANLAHEPLQLGLGGSAPPMELTLRDDCAKLTLSLPPALLATTAGEEPSYRVYVIPDSESTVEPFPVTLRPSTGGTFTLSNLTPGSYRVYTFGAPVQFEYRNPAALASLSNPGQAVTLAPGAAGWLVLEAPEH